MIAPKVFSGKIVDPISREIFGGEVIVESGKISRIERKRVDSDHYILPGFVNAHVHVESSMLAPSEFARLAVRHGSIGAVCDPHEIANVLGVDGVNFMVENSQQSPFKFFFGVPSCVPATDFETSGAKITAKDIDKMFATGNFHFLAEMMNFPGVIFEDESVMEKLAIARKYNKKIDGHAPGLLGNDMVKYFASGITTDHECSSYEEALEKIQKANVKIMIREGSAAKDLEALHKLIDLYPDNVMLCTDDTHPDDLVKGHLNQVVKTCLSKGLNLFNVLRAATVNPVAHYNLPVGLLQVGDAADLVVVDSLENFKVLQTVIDGNLVFDQGEVMIKTRPIVPVNKFNRQPISASDLEVQATTKGASIRVIEAYDGELFTGMVKCIPKSEKGEIVADVENDLLKIVVVNRYSPQAKPSVGFIKNFGLKLGAMASSVAHDSHNILAVGSNDQDLLLAINKVIENQGGLAVCNGLECLDLKLEIGGLMTSSAGETVASQYELLDKKAKELGTKLKAPFMTLSFMALLVIPRFKIGDKFLFDGEKFEPVPLEVID